jgi:hypothetical protein
MLGPKLILSNLGRITILAVSGAYFNLNEDSWTSAFGAAAISTPWANHVGHVPRL